MIGHMNRAKSWFLRYPLVHKLLRTRTYPRSGILAVGSMFVQ